MIKNFNKIGKSEIRNYSKGQAMLVTVMILGGSIMAASLTSGYLMLLKLRQSSDIVNSAKAIFAADSGIEWDLYRRIKDDDYPKPRFENGASLETFATATSTQSVGKAGQSFRSFELSF